MLAEGKVPTRSQQRIFSMKSFHYTGEFAIDENRMVKLRIPTKFDYFGSNTLSNQQMFEVIISRINFLVSLIGCDIHSEAYSPWNLKFFVSLGHVIGIMICTAHNLYFNDNN